MAASDFLIPLAQQIKKDKTPAGRRAVARILSLVKVKYEAGIYASQSHAENDFQRIAEQACARASD